MIATETIGPGLHRSGLSFEGRFMEFHEIANVFPLMEGDEFKELVRDIAKNGQQQAILTHEGQILDGRNRYRACVEADVEPWVERWSGSSPVEAVLSLNLHRRHLSSGQRSAIANRMLPHLEAEAKKRQGNRAKETSVNDLTQVEKREPERATAQAAKLTGTNRQYVQDAKKLADQAPEMLNRVERGEVTIPQAKRELGWTKPPEPVEKFERPEKPTVGDVMGEDFHVPPRKLSAEQNAFYDISKYLVRLRRMDPEKVAEEWLEEKDEFEVQQQIKDASYVSSWFIKYEKAVEGIAKKHRREAGNLRVVGEE